MIRFGGLINCAEVLDDEHTLQARIGAIAHIAEEELKEIEIAFKRENVSRSRFSQIVSAVNVLREIFRDIRHQKVIDEPTVKSLRMIKDMLEKYMFNAASFGPYGRDYIAFGLPQFVEHNIRKILPHIDAILALA